MEIAPDLIEIRRLIATTWAAVVGPTLATLAAVIGGILPWGLPIRL